MELQLGGDQLILSLPGLQASPAICNLVYFMSCLLESPRPFEQFGSMIDSTEVDGKTFEAFFYNFPRLEKLTVMDCKLDNNPKLTIKLLFSVPLPFDDSQEAENEDIVGAVSSMYKIEKLDVDRQLFLNRDTKYALQTAGAPLMHLKELVLRHVCLSVQHEFSYVVGLMSNCPKLESLKMYHHWQPESEEGKEISDRSMEELLETGEFSCSCFKRLVEVHMKDLTGTRAELEMVQFLLARSPLLRLIKFEPIFSNIQDEIKFLEQVAGFPRASPFAVCEC